MMPVCHPMDFRKIGIMDINSWINIKREALLLLIFSFKSDFSSGCLRRVQQLFQVSKYESNIIIMPGKFLFYLFKL